MEVTYSLSEMVATAIRVELAKRRMSAATLARSSGMTQAYLSRRMTGATTFDLDDIAAIAAAIDIPITDLIPAAAAA